MLRSRRARPMFQIQADSAVGTLNLVRHDKRGSDLARTDELRLIAKVARLYYNRGIRQADIAQQLDLSQATVSRLLKRAEEERIVRITVSVPHGAYTELEEDLQAAYGLKEAIVVDTVEDDEQIMRDLGAAAAYYIETTLKHNEIIGISSWSSTLLEMVEAMHPLPRSSSAQVVQILADSLRRDIEALREIVDADLPFGAGERDDVTLPWRPYVHFRSCLES